jgi:hypothetical protein
MDAHRAGFEQVQPGPIRVKRGLRKELAMDISRSGSTGRALETRGSRISSRGHCSAPREIFQQLRDADRGIGAVEWIHDLPGIPDDLRQPCPIVDRHRQIRRHRFDGGESETLVRRRERETPRWGGDVACGIDRRRESTPGRSASAAPRSTTQLPIAVTTER